MLVFFGYKVARLFDTKKTVAHSSCATWTAAQSLLFKVLLPHGALKVILHCNYNNL